MRALVFIFSVAWMGVGVALVLYTGQVRDFLADFFKKANIKALGLLPLLAGLIFLAASFSQGEILPLFLIIGALAVSKGIFFLFGPQEQVKNLLDWWSVRAGETTLRAWGIVTLVLGIAVFSYVL